MNTLKEWKAETGGKSRLPDFAKMSVDEQLNYMHDADPSPRRDLAASPYTDASVLDKLADDPDSGVRQFVARNSETREKTLEKLVNSGRNDRDLLLMLVTNPYLPRHCLESLANHRDSLVRESVMEHSNLSEDTRREMMADRYR